jgi:cobyrinic acid a,c-diamide synthase
MSYSSSEQESNIVVNIPRIVISACQGHLGKTTLSTGLCAALREQGVAVQPFKKGPDYIDPSWLGAAACRPCRNLDAFMMPEEYLLNSFWKTCQDADFALIEGVMGLYDSYDLGGRGSTAWVARFFGAPIILIVNASRMTRSVAAMISGYQRFEPETNIAGVILNNVSLPGHRKRLEASIERYCEIPVVGCLPHHEDLSMAEQHLGLLPYRSTENADSVISRISRTIKKFLDLKSILAIAQKSDAACVPPFKTLVRKTRSVKIGIVRDKAFCFYYQANLDALQNSGAQLVFVDALSDRNLPQIDGLYIGGGFPELFADELENNIHLRGQILREINNGLPVYAECAGMMYLCKGLRWRNLRHEMVGALPYDAEMCPQTQGHGYVVAEVIRKNPWFSVGLHVRGHQFHHSRLINTNDTHYAFRLKRKRRKDSANDGIVHKNIFASYTHLHASSVPEWADVFVSLALQRQQQSRSISPLRD